MQKRKLIEVALPLEAINRESAREKSIRHGHPSTLHLWWSRKPLATARAVLFAQLVDDPSSHPDRFPTEQGQRVERERLHSIIERLVKWENVDDHRLIAEARREINASSNGSPPPVLDPFAGGGSIPLEAQRLGLTAHSSDLNPVAVMINKALVEFPPTFGGLPPVFPGLATSQIRTWKRAEGLSEDVRGYGYWMLEEARRRIGHLYPIASTEDGAKASVIAWIWARTVFCPNPGCGIEMPLVASWWLAKKKGKETYVTPSVVNDAATPSGKRVNFTISTGAAGVDSASIGTVSKSGAICVACGGSAPLSYVRSEGRQSRLGSTLMAVAVEGKRRRVYMPPTAEHRKVAASVELPVDLPDAELPEHALGFRVQAYGMRRWTDLFTDRQLLTLATFSDLVDEARKRVLTDALAAGQVEGDRLEDGGRDAAAYADAVATYLGLTISRLADLANSLCGWEPLAECPRHLFVRQAISLIWAFAEGNPLGESSGSWSVLLEGTARSFSSGAFSRADVPSGLVRQASADDCDFAGFAISTDPPYYDNICYSDLSDFFYVWERRALREIHPSLLKTVLVPKAEELVANPYRSDGPEGAREFFESGFRKVFAKAREVALPDVPMTVYYAFKQSRLDGDEQSSTGWETLLEGMIRSGWSITATWPMRTENSSRIRAHDSNALASSIVIALRPRSNESTTTDRRGFIQALHSELPDALKNLQQGQVAPVDLPQAAIGPGMAVFSRYSNVVEADGSTMTVRSALARINEILDEVLAEQEGDFDSVSRFAIAWYRQHGYGTGVFGAADDLARARNTSVELMDRHGILISRAGKVKLIKPADLPPDYDPATDLHTSNWEAMHHLIRTLESDGIAAAGGVLASATNRPDGAVDPDLVKELAFLLFSIAEKNGWTKDAFTFNALAQSWPEIVSASRDVDDSVTVQAAFDYDQDEES